MIFINFITKLIVIMINDYQCSLCHTRYSFIPPNGCSCTDYKTTIFYDGKESEIQRQRKKAQANTKANFHKLEKKKNLNNSERNKTTSNSKSKPKYLVKLLVGFLIFGAVASYFEKDSPKPSIPNGNDTGTTITSSSNVSPSGTSQQDISGSYSNLEKPSNATLSNSLPALQQEAFAMDNVIEELYYCGEEVRKYYMPTNNFFQPYAKYLAELANSYNNCQYIIYFDQCSIEFQNKILALKNHVNKEYNYVINNLNSNTSPFVIKDRIESFAETSGLIFEELFAIYESNPYTTPVEKKF